MSEILSRVATGGTSVEPAFELVDEGLAARLDATRPATVRGYVAASDMAATERAVASVEAALGHLGAFGLRPIGELVTRVVHEADWATAWKRHFPVLRIGRRMVVRPTWRRHRPARDEVVVTLDPGMAFGTGLHPTTRLSLVALERVADEGSSEALSSVLDVGCGSGILSIAAAQLGAVRVLGLDIDPIAVEATAANVRRNHLSRRVRARRGSLPSRQVPFQLVLANLVASVLVDLATGLAAELRPGGRLIAAGIMSDRESDVRTAFAANGLQIEARDVEGDWVALTAVRPA